MKAQERKDWCGVAALQAALEFYGYKRSQDYLAKMCWTNKAGTDERKLIRGIERCGFTPWGAHLGPSEVTAKAELAETITPQILCVDKWEHWVTLLGWTGNRAIVFDPANGAGVYFPTWPQLKKRWCAGPKTIELCNGEPGMPYYLIGVSR